MVAGLNGMTLAIVSAWCFSPSQEGRHARWAGLILGSGEKGYVRKGVFLGPDCDGGLVGWKREKVDVM